MEKSDIAVVIQAGGRSSRMGQNKALMDIQGKSVIERTCDRIGNLGSHIFIVTDLPNLFTFLPGVQVIPDLYPGRGPLGGFVTVFDSVLFPFIIMCACDMPFANPDLFQLALNKLVDQQVDVVIPKMRGRLEPLHAVYRRETCINPARQRFASGAGKIIDWFSDVRVEILDDEIILKTDPDGYAFYNINTFDDFTAAQSIYLNHFLKD